MKYGGCDTTCVECEDSILRGDEVLKIDGHLHHLQCAGLQVDAQGHIINPDGPDDDESEDDDA